MSAFMDRAPPKADASPTDQAHRQPSQQELEIARQLQHFHAQNSLPVQDDDTAAVGQNDAEPSHANDAEIQKAGSPVASENSDHYSQSAGPSLTGQVCTNCGTTKTPLWRRSPAGAVICNACGLYYKARNQMRPVGLKRTPVPLSSGASSQMPDQPQDRSTSPTPLQSGANYVSADQVADGTCPGGGRCNSQGGKLICQGCPSFNNRIAKAAQVALRQAGDQNTHEADPTKHQSINNGSQTVVIACQNCGTTVTPLWRRDEAGNAICNACGLYHKLHGHHRPVQMKKAEIKRRKRVVPANNTYESTTNSYSEHRTQSASPNLSNQHIAPLEPRMGPSPIPVNFTDAFRSDMSQTHPSGSHSIPSKRPYSATTTTTAEAEPYPHAQNMGFSAINAIDPALPTRNEGAPLSKEARRAELQREADKMRQMLEDKERELAALAEDV